MVLRGGQAISSAGSQVSDIAFPLLVLALTHSAAQAAIVGACNTIPNFLFMLPAGTLVDRWNRKRTMILCDMGRVVALASIPVASGLHHLTLVQLGTAAFFEGTLAVLFGLSERVAVAHVVSRQQLTAAMAQNEAVASGAQMLGPSLGGMLFSASRLMPFLVDAISYAISVASLLLVRAEFQERRATRPLNVRAEIGEGLRWVWNHPFLRMSTFLIAAANLLFQANFLAIIVRAEHLHAPPTAIGLIFSLFGIGGLVGSLATPWFSRRATFSQVIIGVNWIWALLWPLYALISFPLLFGVIGGFMELVGAVWNVLLASYALTAVPDALQGRVRSTVRLVGWGTIPLGSALSGILLETIGSTSAILVLALCMVAVASIATASGAIRHGPTAAVSSLS